MLLPNFSFVVKNQLNTALGDLLHLLFENCMLRKLFETLFLEVILALASWVESLPSFFLLPRKKANAFVREFVILIKQFNRYYTQ